MSDFIIGVVVDIYRHVLVEYLNGFGVGFIPGSSWNLAVLDAAEFVVLDPKIGLEYLERRCKPEQSGITGSDPRLNLNFLAERC